jgi:hypothetical protein
MRPKIVLGIWMICFSASVTAQYLQGEEKKQGIAGCTGNCNKAQTESALNQASGLTALQINTYCQCYCTEMASRLTMQEFANLARTNVLTDFVKAQIAEASPICVEQVRQLNK